MWNPAWIGPFAPRELAEALAKPAPAEQVYEDAIAAWNATDGDLIDRTLQFYTRLYLTDDILVKSDRTAMMHSVEARAPFLDLDVVDLARRIPSRLKLRHGETKFVLKTAIKGLLPDWVLQRRKQGFGVPVGRWLAEGGLRLEPRPDNLYSISRSTLDRLMNEHKSAMPPITASRYGRSWCCRARPAVIETKGWNAATDIRRTASRPSASRSRSLSPSTMRRITSRRCARRCSRR